MTVRMRALAVVLLVPLLAACGDDGGLSELERDPVVTMEIPGASETDLRTDAGGRQLGKDTPARVFRFFELDAGAAPDDVLEAALRGAEDAGWEYERAGNVAERTARLRKESGGHALSLFVDLSAPPALQLTLTTS